MTLPAGSIYHACKSRAGRKLTILHALAAVALGVPASTAPANDAWKVFEEIGNQVYSLFQQSNYEPPVRSPKNISLAKGVEVTDCVLEARVKQTRREYGHRDFCVFFG